MIARIFLGAFKDEKLLIQFSTLPYDHKGALLCSSTFQSFQNILFACVHINFVLILLLGRHHPSYGGGGGGEFAVAFSSGRLPDGFCRG